MQPSTKLAKMIKDFRARRPADLDPAFHFPPQRASLRLQYTPVDYDNYHILHELFHQDDWPFINKHFKDRERLDEYVVILKEWVQYSVKYCACDWIIYRSADRAPIGVLHLYDLSRIGKGKNDHRCTIGFAIQNGYRRQGYAAEAVHNLLSYIFRHFHVDSVLAYTALHNEPTLQLLRKLSFRRQTNGYNNTEHFAFFEMNRADFSMLSL